MNAFTGVNLKYLWTERKSVFTCCHLSNGTFQLSNRLTFCCRPPNRSEWEYTWPQSFCMSALPLLMLDHEDRWAVVLPNEKRIWFKFGCEHVTETRFYWLCLLHFAWFLLPSWTSKEINPNISEMMGDLLNKKDKDVEKLTRLRRTNRLTGEDANDYQCKRADGGRSHKRFYFCSLSGQAVYGKLEKC